MDTAHKTVTFRFAPGSDQPNVIVRKLVDQDCLSECHMNAVIEQLDKTIEVIKENPSKSVGLRLTSIVEQQPNAPVIRQQPMEIHHPTVITPSEESNPIVPSTSTTTTPAVPVKISRFSVAPCQLNGPTVTDTTPAIPQNQQPHVTPDVTMQADETDASSTIAETLAINSIPEKVSRFSVTPSQLNGMAPDSAPATIHLGDLQVNHS